MILTDSDVEELGITAATVNKDGDMIACKGEMPKTQIKFLKHKFSLITDKIIYWAELELDYAGG